VAAGVRRIEALTGDNALAWAQQTSGTLQHAAALLKTQPADLSDRIVQMQAQLKSLERDLEQAKSKLASAAGSDLADKAVELSGGVKLLASSISGADPKALRSMVDQLKDRLKSAVVLLATSSDGKISLAAGVTADLVGKVKAGDLVGMVAAQVGGKGGGRPDMAMGGGTDESALPGVLAQVHDWVQQRLEG
jgi:alanyl-tRNA synthetase